MSADQLNRISPDHSLLPDDLLLSFEGELSDMIYEKFVNFVPKPIIFKQKLCVGVLRSKAESRQVEQIHNLFVTSSGKDNSKIDKKVLNSAQSNISAIPLCIGHAFKMFPVTSVGNWWPAGYRGTPKIFRYTGKILPVASLLQSAFSVSISGQH